MSSRATRGSASYATATDNLFLDLRSRLQRLIEDKPGCSICDVGGGAHPFLLDDPVLRGVGRYTLLDISESELQKAPSKFERIECDLTAHLVDARDISSGALVDLSSKFDLAFSATVAEHIEKPHQFHENIFKMLKPGGSALHVFPTLFTVAFAINKILPESLSSVLNSNLSPDQRHTRDKFPAFYRWCTGPTKSAIARFERMGWEVVEYRGYYGHGYYKKVAPLNKLHQWKTRLLEARPVAALTNYALLWLRKPVQ